ncbi:mg-protoporphyrin ix methyltransferase [Nannochloropsis oceanica]
MMAATKPKPPTGGVDDKTEVREYFNTEGFQRWNRIYSEDGTVNKVQADIRVGHQQTVDKILGWLEADGVKGESICDAGCGVGSLAIPMAKLGAKVSASDISSSMANEGKLRAEAVLGKATARARCAFSTSDLEALKGKYDTVTCVDVMIHYPTDKMQGMVSKLGSLAKKRMIISFAPKTWYYDILKQIGGLFPGPSKTTRAYLHTEADVRKALEEAGFTVKRTDMTATNFYFSRLLEAVRE